MKIYVRIKQNNPRNYTSIAFGGKDEEEIAIKIGIIFFTNYTEEEIKATYIDSISYWEVGETILDWVFDEITYCNGKDGKGNTWIEAVDYENDRKWKFRTN